MTKKNNFIRWFIVFMASLTATVLAQQYGVLEIMIKNDISYICVGILFLYFVVSIFAGRTAFLVDEKVSKYDDSYYDSLYDNDKMEIKKRLNILWFISEHFLTLGLIGTMTGFIFVMYGSLNESLEIKQIINQLKVGVGTALNTTIFGLIYSLALQLQTFILQNNLDLDE